MKKSFCRTFTAAVLLSIFWVSASAQSQSFVKAKAAYDRANFEHAVALFSELVENSNADQEEARKGYRYLARSYSAMGLGLEAKAAIDELLNLEPPVVVFDPDREPPPLMNLYYQARRDRGGYSVEKGEGTINTLAVIDFTNGSFGPYVAEYAPLGAGLASMMINYLGGATGLKVIERERLRWLMRELELQRDSALVDQEVAVRVGKLLGAQSVLIGSFIVNGEQVYLGSRLVKVETGEVLLGEQIFGNTDEIFELVRRLSLQTAKAIDVALANRSTRVPDDTHALESLMAYSRGLQFLESSEYQAAFDAFGRALSFDPDYEQASLRRESLRPVIAAIARR